MSLIKKDSNKNKKPLKVTAVIVAAGNSSRMGGIDKITAPVAGKSVLEHSVTAFASCADISEIIVVTREDLIKFALEVCGKSGGGKVSAVITGGESRTESAYLGVIRAEREADIIMIHDGARPLVVNKVIKDTIEAAAEYEAALPVVRVKDTLKEGRDGFVTATPDRSRLYAAQTPQAFRAELIKAALTDAINKKIEYTDDCAAVEKLGMNVRLTEGSVDNIKITAKEDLIIAEALFRAREPH